MAQRLSKATETSVASWLNMQTLVDIWEAENNPQVDYKSISPLNKLSALAGSVSLPTPVTGRQIYKYRHAGVQGELHSKLGCLGVDGNLSQQWHGYSA